jgi:hypothetical protein
MAEIAIPLIALGSMYIMSNQKCKQREQGQMQGRQGQQKEGFQNMNYSKFPLASGGGILASGNVHDSTREIQTTDKFFDPANYAKREEKNGNTDYSVGGNLQQTYALTGNPINKQNFTHNNMVPFFGAKIRGASVDRNITESVLDNMQGQGSQLFRKQEMAPLFKPQEGMQYANGAPNMSDFMQSRVNPSLRMANIKPWEEQRVAPGLNQGFTTQGSNGFNSGLEARDSWLPKTVNELRVDSNPKLTFGLQGHEGPGNAYIKNAPSVQTQGKVEKYLPEKYFASGPERWLTTTGLEKGQTVRSEEMLHDVNRTDAVSDYFGVKAGVQEGTYQSGAYEESKKQILPNCDLAVPSLVGKNGPTMGDYGIQGYNNSTTNRSTTCPETASYGAIGGFMKALVSPVLDVLRPSRKENVINNCRQAGNVQSNVPQSVIFNPADRVKTTIKEMTEGRLDCNHLNVEKQMANAYLVTETQPVHVQRDTTNRQHTGNAGPSGAYNVSKSYEAEYMQRNNVNKTYGNRPNQGGMQLFNSQENICTNKNDCDRENNRLWVRNAAPSFTTPSKEMYGHIHKSQTYDERMNCERIAPDILTAFKNNPYTHSLHSAV